MPQSFAAVHLHLIFSTKGREPLLTPELLQKLRQYVAGILPDFKCRLANLNGVVDHVHLLVSLGREISIAELLRRVKAGSSRWLHDTVHDFRRFAWQEGYGSFSVSPSQLAKVNRYIDRQPEHHQHKSFQDEFREFLTAHGEDWDERYVWD